MPLTEFVKLGDHLFSKDALDKVIAETVPKVPEGKTRAIAATVDADGAKVGVVIGSSNGRWVGKMAAAHDWAGDNKVAGSVMFSW